MKLYKYLPLAPATVLALVLGTVLFKEYGYPGIASALVMAVAFELVNLILADHAAKHAMNGRNWLLGITLGFQVVYMIVAFLAIVSLGKSGDSNIIWFLAATPVIIGLALISGGLDQAVERKVIVEEEKAHSQEEKARLWAIEDKETAHRQALEAEAQALAHKQAMKAIPTAPKADRNADSVRTNVTDKDKKIAFKNAVGSGQYNLEELTGSLVSDDYGVTDRTGRRWIKELIVTTNGKENHNGTS